MFAPQVRILVGVKGPNPEGEYTAQKTYLVLGFSDREVRIQGTQETKTKPHVLLVDNRRQFHWERVDIIDAIPPD